jgi:hypothetical protein
VKIIDSLRETAGDENIGEVFVIRLTLGCADDIEEAAEIRKGLLLELLIGKGLKSPFRCGCC